MYTKTVPHKIIRNQGSRQAEVFLGIEIVHSKSNIFIL